MGDFRLNIPRPSLCMYGMCAISQIISALYLENRNAFSLLLLISLLRRYGFNSLFSSLFILFFFQSISSFFLHTAETLLPKAYMLIYNLYICIYFVFVLL